MRSIWAGDLHSLFDVAGTRAFSPRGSTAANLADVAQACRAYKMTQKRAGRPCNSRSGRPPD
jgi:hypothetical protein